MLTHKQLSEPESLRSSLIFAKTMSSEEVGDKPEGKGEIFESSTAESVAEGVEGKGANKRQVSEKDMEEGKETQERNTLTGEIIGRDNHRGKNTPARESVKTAPDKRELTNLDLKDNKGDRTLAEKSPEKESDEQRSDPERKRQPKLIHIANPGTKSQSSYFPLAGILAAAVACIAVAIYLAPPKNDMKTDFDLERVFGNGLEELQLSFTNQTERFWKNLRSRGLTHLRNKDPSQPLVFLLAAPPAAHEWVDCLAIKLAEVLDPKNEKTLAGIDGEKEKANLPEKTKMTMDNLLKTKIETLHKVVLIHHLELLPTPSQLLFHSYCDDQNAPYKELTFIFTVHIPEEPSPSLSLKETEGSVEKYLSGDVWAKDDKDAVAALLVRIADTVVLMNGETSGSLRDLCSKLYNC